MFRPNHMITIHRRSGKTDAYGQPLGTIRVTERCAIVKLEVSNVNTTVRADSSASRGHGKEIVADALVLLEKTTVAQIDDMVEIDGGKFRVIAKHPRYSVTGALDHYEVAGAIWS